MIVNSYTGTKQKCTFVPFLSVRFAPSLNVSSTDYNQEQNIECVPSIKVDSKSKVVEIIIQDHGVRHHWVTTHILPQRMYGNIYFTHTLTNSVCVCVRAQLCLILYDPMDCSLPGTSVHGIFQARILEWFAISYSTHQLSDQIRSVAQSCLTLCDPMWTNFLIVIILLSKSLCFDFNF